MEYNKNNIHYIAITGIIVNRRDTKNKYLIVKRASTEKDFANEYTVPGGKLEVDDYINEPKTTDVSWYNILENALRREIKEEVGLEVDNIKYLLSLTFIRKDGIPVVVLSYYCDYESGEVELDDSLEEYKWVTLEEARGYNLISGI